MARTEGEVVAALRKKLEHLATKNDGPNGPGVQGWQSWFWDTLMGSREGSALMVDVARILMEPEGGPSKQAALESLFR